MLYPTFGARLAGLAVVASGFLLADAAICRASTWHVSPAGSDLAGDGSPASPWREVRRALASVQPGDTVLAADGTYLGFTVDGLGSTASPIVLKAEGRAAEVVPTSDRGAQFDPDNIAVWNSTNIVIDGFRSFRATRAAARVVSSNQVTIRNCVFGDNGVWAIVTSHSDDAVVEDCDLFGSRAQHGIYFANSGDRPVARGNRIHHNAGSGIRAYGDSTQGGDGLVSGAVFENNRIYGNYGGAGMNLNAFKDAVIRNNLIHDNHASSGIALFLGEGGIGVGNIEVSNNTIDVPADGKYDLRILGVQAPITLRNNVLINRTATKGPYSWGSPADAAATDGDHGVVGGSLFVSDDDEVTRRTWADWQGSGHEAATVVATAASLFVDDSSSDYRLKTGCVAIDAGVALASVTRDLDGRPRPSGAASDIGAYEAPSAASPGCGDGVVQGGLGEQCDDGNLAGGDCCSATCQWETAGSACTGADPCLRSGSCDGSGVCTDLVAPTCGASWQSGQMIVDEGVAGEETMSLRLKKGSSTTQADFGDPVPYGGTRYTACIYDDAANVVARLVVARAGDACGAAKCWKSAGHRPLGHGYRYKDRNLAADGIQVLVFASGGAGKGSAQLLARNDAAHGHVDLVTGIAASLASSSSATVRFVPSDGPLCFSATLQAEPGATTTLYRARK